MVCKSSFMSPFLMNNQTYDILNHGIAPHFSCRRTGFGRGLVVAVILLGMLPLLEPVSAQNTIDTHREYNVKAVTLYAIGRYVKWPESSFSNEQSPFVIGILGPNPFGNTLQRIAEKKTIHGRAILVNEFATIKDYASPCHILFVTRSTPPADEEELLEKTQGLPVLLVGESVGFGIRGGVINFYVDGNHVRFELNADQALRSQLVLNAKMHNLGTRVSSTR